MYSPLASLNSTSLVAVGRDSHLADLEIGFVGCTMLGRNRILFCVRPRGGILYYVIIVLYLYMYNLFVDYNVERRLD